MGLIAKHRRLERGVGEDSTELQCQECGERLKVSRDIALRLTYAAWCKRRGERRGEPIVNDYPVIKLIERHPHNALVNVRTGRLPGLPGMSHAR